MGLKGPSMTCDTDGSSSLTAVHLGGEAVLTKGLGVSNECLGRHWKDIENHRKALLPTRSYWIIVDPCLQNLNVLGYTYSEWKVKIQS